MPYHSRVWVFHRGCHLEKIEGYFLHKKIGLIFTYTVGAIYQYCCQACCYIICLVRITWVTNLSIPWKF